MMYKLIIVDDEQNIRKTIAAYVKKFSNNFEVVGSFSNGRDTVEYLENHDVDVVISDIKMPLMDGLELVKHITENYPLIKTLIISGYAEFEYAQKAIQYGVSAYLLKVIDPQEFASALTRIKSELDEGYKYERLKSEDIGRKREKFILDVMKGILDDTQKINDEFYSLETVYSSLEVKTSVVNITVSNFSDMVSSWKYEREALEKALINIFNKIDEKIYVVPVYFTDGEYIAVVFGETSVYDYVKKATLEAEELGIFVNFRVLKSYENFGGLTGEYKVFVNEDKSVLSNESDVKKSVEQKTEIIRQALEYIDNNLDKDISRDDLAARFFFNPSYFNNIFKKYTGYTISNYLYKVRMEKAIEYLKTSMKIYEISEKVGYKSLRHFQRTFKVYSGYSLSDYRRYVLAITKEQDKKENEE